MKEKEYKDMIGKWFYFRGRFGDETGIIRIGSRVNVAGCEGWNVVEWEPTRSFYNSYVSDEALSRWVEMTDEEAKKDIIKWTLKRMDIEKIEPKVNQNINARYGFMGSATPILFKVKLPLEI